MKEFKILKKNRKYFACEFESGCPFKLLIDSNSQGLDIGDHTLDLIDNSVRSKYGTDLKFSLKASPEEIKSAGICTLQHDRYNKTLHSKCKQLGGKWDSESCAWIFSGLVENEVEDLDEIYNSELASVELSVNHDGVYSHTDAVYIAGYKAAQAFGRDTGAKLSDGIAVISGGFTSAGSMKNWCTQVREGTVIRMQIPEKLLTNIDSNDWSIKIL